MKNETLSLRRPGALPALAFTLLSLFTVKLTALSASDQNVAEPRAAVVPMDQLGAIAGQQYHGDGLAVTPTAAGARMRCDFQRLQGEVTSVGLWLNSSVSSGVADRFQVTAAAVGRAAVQALPRTGTVAIEGQTVRFIRSGLVEEYSTSMDGIRQDFVLAERPAGVGPLRVELGVTGADVEQTVYGAKLVLANSGRKLAYSRLKVSDATGRELSARLDVLDNGSPVAMAFDPEIFTGLDHSDQLASSVTKLAVVVEDASAVYPVRIDPTFSDANWISMGGAPGTDDDVNAAVVDGSGNIYIGGRFTSVGGVAASGIAKWDGTNWSALGSGIEVNSYSDTVWALAVSGNVVYAGGAFQKAGGIDVNNVAKWDGTNWSALGSGVDPVNGRVDSLAVSGNDLYVGGHFGTADGITVNHIAKWNGSTWSALGSGMGVGPYFFVNALAISGNDVYAGGYFGSAGGSTVNYIAKWNGSNWSALGSGMDATVYALAMSGSDLYAGGVFDTAGGIPVGGGIAKWNGSAWSAVGAGPGGKTGSLAVSGGNVYAGGTAGVSKWNGSTWTVLGSGFNDIVNTLAASGNNVYAGGLFNSVNGKGANHLAKWDGSSWSVPGGGSGLSDTVQAIAISGNDLYVGGAFGWVGGTTVYGVAKWNGTNWSALGSGMDNEVRALAISGNTLYASGHFTKAGGITVNGIARWNGSTWSALGSGVGLGGFAYTLAVVGNNLYAGGTFTAIGGNVIRGLARWNGSSWSSVGAGVNGEVGALAVSGNDLYVGGSFSTAGGTTAYGIAKWNGSTWSTLGSVPAVGLVSSLAVSGNNVYVSSNSGERISKWDGTNWTNLPIFIFHTVSGAGSLVQALAASGDDLYLGGKFDTAGVSGSGNVSMKVNFIVKWDGNNVSALGAGMNHPVQVLTISGNTLYAGGDFTLAGGKGSAYLAKAILPTAEGRFQNWTYSPVTGFSCTFTGGTVGQPYRIQTSTTLAAGSWIDISNFTYTAPVVISDASAVSGTNQFFRAVSP